MASLETVNVGKAVAARVGTNIREVRTKLGLTQAQLASPEFSISYISAIERGKIRPSLKALSILARRLDVPLTFLLEGNKDEVNSARAQGYSPADNGPDNAHYYRLSVIDTLLAMGKLEEAKVKLAEMTAIPPEKLSTDQVYQLFYLQAVLHQAIRDEQQTIVFAQQALQQAEALVSMRDQIRSLLLLGRANLTLGNGKLANEQHTQARAVYTLMKVDDPFLLIDILKAQGDDQVSLGLLPEAMKLYTQAQECALRLGRREEELATTWLTVAQRYADVGMNTVAYQLATSAKQSMVSQQLTRIPAMLAVSLATAYEQQQDYHNAIALFEKALQDYIGLSDIAAQVDVLTSLALAHLELDQLDQAHEHVSNAVTVSSQCSCVRSKAHALVATGRVYHRKARHMNEGERQGAIAEATQAFLEAIKLLEGHNLTVHAARAYYHYATMLEEHGDPHQTIAAYRKAHELQAVRS